MVIEPGGWVRTTNTASNQPMTPDDGWGYYFVNDLNTGGRRVMVMSNEVAEISTFLNPEPAVVITKAEYDALVAAAPPAEYEPVPNGTYNKVAVSDDRLYLRLGYKTATVSLPDTWRLMRPRQDG